MRPVRKNALLAATVLSLYAAHAFADVKSAERAMTQQRYADAVAELQPLVKGGDTRAQADLGTLLILGQGLPRDDAAGFALLSHSAKAGDPMGDIGLALFYLLRQPGPDSYGSALPQARAGGQRVRRSRAGQPLSVGAGRPKKLPAGCPLAAPGR
jgi:TPR repeat protein